MLWLTIDMKTAIDFARVLTLQEDRAKQQRPTESLDTRHGHLYPLEQVNQWSTQGVSVGCFDLSQARVGQDSRKTVHQQTASDQIALVHCKIVRQLVLLAE